MADQQNSPDGRSMLDQLPVDDLKRELRGLVTTVASRGVHALRDRVGGAAGRVGHGVGQGIEHGAESAREAGGRVRAGAHRVGEAVTPDGARAGRAGPGGVTNIVEEIDVGVPVRVAYDQWTRFTDFPGFMKKVENVDQVSDTEVRWRGRVLWSSREWRSTIIDQVPDHRIIWQSEGDKGYVNGAVTFHGLTPDLTRILVVLEYHPSGLLERTGNLWRAQGRRVRLELKHFRRHVMTTTALHPEQLRGWRGEIHESGVRSGDQGGPAGQGGSAEPGGSAGQGEAAGQGGSAGQGEAAGQDESAGQGEPTGRGGSAGQDG